MRVGMTTTRKDWTNQKQDQGKTLATICVICSDAEDQQVESDAVAKTKHYINPRHAFS